MFQPGRLVAVRHQSGRQRCGGEQGVEQLSRRGFPRRLQHHCGRADNVQVSESHSSSSGLKYIDLNRNKSVAFNKSIGFTFPPHC